MLLLAFNVGTPALDARVPLAGKLVAHGIHVTIEPFYPVALSCPSVTSSRHGHDSRCFTSYFLHLNYYPFV